MSDEKKLAMTFISGEPMTIKMGEEDSFSQDDIIMNPSFEKERLTIDEAIKTIARLALEVEMHGRIRSKG
jgi:hypothetical protein